MFLSPKDLIKEDEEVSSLPIIFYQVMEAVNDPESSFEDIGTIIGNDVALTARLLKIVNSSFYGFSSKVETITHALNIVGTEQLCNMVLATSVMSRFKGIPERFVTIESFWCHGVATGLAARRIANLKHEPSLERFYVAGMIHDVGNLIIYKKIPELAEEALIRCNEWGQSLCEAERSIMGFDHTEVGQVLMDKWKLPELLVEIVTYHHTPLQAPNFSKEAAIIHLADYIAQGSQLGSSGELKPPPLDPEIWKFLDLSQSSLSSLPKQMFDLFEDTVQLFAG